MVIAAEYPFLSIFGTMVLFFTWVIWIWMMIGILSDVFRRQDISGLGKAGWTVFLIVLPFVGALIYLITNNDGMAQRSLERGQESRARYDGYAQNVAGNGGGGAAAEIKTAKSLLDSGGISQAEFEALKAKALA